MSLQAIQQIPAGATPVSTEGTVLTGTPLSIGIGAAMGLLFLGWITITIGTGATGIQLRLRQVTTTNIVDQVIAVTGLVAGNTYALPFSFNDTGVSYDDSGHATYNLSVQQTGAPSAAGAVTGGEMIVEA